LIQFLPPDYLLFPREGAVFAQKLDVLKRFGAVADPLAQVPRIAC
jgi:hypothetical protein